MCCSFKGTVIDGAPIISSTHQKEVNSALKQLLGTAVTESMDTAVPAATTDIFSLTAELDSVIAPGGQTRRMLCWVA